MRLSSTLPLYGETGVWTFLQTWRAVRHTLQSVDQLPPRLSTRQPRQRAPEGEDTEAHFAKCAPILASVAWAGAARQGQQKNSKRAVSPRDAG